MHIQNRSQQQPGTQRQLRMRSGKGCPPLLREQGQDVVRILQDVLAGKEIQFHTKIIPKNAPESKEGEPARSL